MFANTSPERIESSNSTGENGRTAWSLAEFCRECGISRATAYRRIADGSLRVVKLGKLTRISAAERQRLGL